jgi:hypothetical protein
MYNTSFFIKRQVKNPSMADEFLQVKAQDDYSTQLEPSFYIKRTSNIAKRSTNISEDTACFCF